MSICQSCGMNIAEDQYKGTNVDGSLSQEFCSYCFQNGKYTNNRSLEEQVEVGLSFDDKYQNASIEEKEKIKEQAKNILSNLKRWNCTCTEECASGYNPHCTCTSSECHCTEKK